MAFAYYSLFFLSVSVLGNVTLLDYLLIST